MQSELAAAQGGAAKMNDARLPEQTGHYFEAIGKRIFNLRALRSPGWACPPRAWIV